MMPIVDKTGYSEFEWTVKAAKNGSPTLLFGNRAVHSQYNPQREAETLAKNIIQQAREEHADHIIMLGMGLGYLPDALFTSGWENLIIWDPFPKMQQEFPRIAGEWQTCLTITQFFRHFEPKINEFIKDGAKPKVVCHQNYDIYTGYEYRKLLDHLSSIYSPKKPTIVSERSLETLVRLPGLGTVKPFENFYQDGTAIAVAPGPSLKRHINILRDKNGIKLFAPIQAVPMLRHEGIHVDFMVSADPEDMGMFLKDIRKDDFDVFLAELASHPATLDWHPGHTALFALESDQLYNDLWKSKKQPVIDIHGATVSELMVVLAQYMGFENIVCLGMDMCWQDERYHGFRSTNNYDQRNMELDARFKLQDVTQTIVTTQTSYFHACRFFNDYISRTGNDSINYYQNDAGLDKGMVPLTEETISILSSANPPLKKGEAYNASNTFTRMDIKYLLDEMIKYHSLHSNNATKSNAAAVFKPKEDLKAIPKDVLIDRLTKFKSESTG